MGNWYTRLRDRLPVAPIVETLVEQVEALPGISGWSPERGLEMHSSDILHWGLVLWSTRALIETTDLLREIGSQIVAADRPNPETFAELSAAGLCVVLGATGGEKLRRARHKTADWRLQWPDNCQIDVEVTTARRKRVHVQRNQAACAIAASLFAPEMVDDLVVHMVDSTDEKDTNAVLAAAMSVDKGACIENPGRWQVRREEVSRQVTEIVSGQLDTRPRWWPEHNIRSFVMRGFLAGPESTKAPAQVRLLFGVPLDAYINPVMNKADAPQGLVGHPFLLAVDVMALAGAMTEIPEIVRGHFGHWSRLSGILLYMDMVVPDETGWRWKLLANPTATWPLPASLLDGKANLVQAMGAGLRFGDVDSAPEQTG